MEWTDLCPVWRTTEGMDTLDIQLFKPQDKSIMTVVFCYENITRVDCVRCDCWVSLLRSRFVRTWLWMCQRPQQTQLCQPCLLKLPPQCCQWPGSPPRPHYLHRPHRHLTPWWRSATRQSSSPPHSQGKHQVGRRLTRGQNPKFGLYIVVWTGVISLIFYLWNLG